MDTQESTRSSICSGADQLCLPDELDYCVNRHYQPGMVKVSVSLPDLQANILNWKKNTKITKNAKLDITIRDTGDMGVVTIIYGKDDEKHFAVKIDPEDVGTRWFLEPDSYYSVRSGEIRFYLKKRHGLPLSVG